MVGQLKSARTHVAPVAAIAFTSRLISAYDANSTPFSPTREASPREFELLVARPGTAHAAKTAHASATKSRLRRRCMDVLRSEGGQSRCTRCVIGSPRGER